MGWGDWRSFKDLILQQEETYVYKSEVDNVFRIYFHLFPKTVFLAMIFFHSDLF